MRCKAIDNLFKDLLFPLRPSVEPLEVVKMLDPMTALGLASNIVQLVSFGGELISRGKELSKTGCTSEHAHVRTIAKDIGDLSAGLVRDR